MAEQLFFNFDFTPVKSFGKNKVPRGQRTALQRAALRWLAGSEKPSGLASDVATRISRLRANIAAFWSKPARNTSGEGPFRILQPYRTMLIQCYTQRDECWPDCIKSAGTLTELKQVKQQLEIVCEEVRRTEPKLRCDDTLFEEFAEWRYEASTNPEYQRLARAREKLENALYRGTKFERIRQAHLADQLYLAVPENLVSPEEMADGWGLLWVGEDLSVRLMQEAETRDCMVSNRMHLVQNIAAANLESALRIHGISQRGKKAIFIKPAPRRRKEQNPQYPKKN